MKLEPFRFDQMRPGCYDVDARVRDMDINGVWASVNFPSQITGFCGRVFFGGGDRELGVACVRAWNDWLFEEWYEQYPERIVPLGITYLADPGDGGRRDPPQRRARASPSVTLPRAPARDRPAVAVGRATTGIRSSTRASRPTPSISLHVGSSGMHAYPPGAPAAPARRHAVRPAVARARAPSGCGRGTRCITRT